MTSLLDIAPLSSPVVVQGEVVQVTGISALGIATLIGKFPEVRAMLSSRKVDITPERLFTLVPEAVASIIAAGCGHPGDLDYEAAAARLSVSDQMALVEKVIELTMPEGIGPFVERVHSLMGRAEDN